VLKLELGMLTNFLLPAEDAQNCHADALPDNFSRNAPPLLKIAQDSKRELQHNLKVVGTVPATRLDATLANAPHDGLGGRTMHELLRPPDRRVALQRYDHQPGADRQHGRRAHSNGIAMLADENGRENAAVNAARAFGDRI